MQGEDTYTTQNANTGHSFQQCVVWCAHHNQCTTSAYRTVWFCAIHWDKRDVRLGVKVISSDISLISWATERWSSNESLHTMGCGLELDRGTVRTALSLQNVYIYFPFTDYHNLLAHQLKQWQVSIIPLYSKLPM